MLLYEDSIVGPSIIVLTIRAALAFNNKLSILELTVRQLVAAAENSVSRNPAADGRFPQVAGMLLEFDPSNSGVEGQMELDTPSRVKTLIVTKADGTTDVVIDNFTVQGDLSRTFVVATNSFLTTGGDGYAAFSVANRLGETTLGEQRILQDYIMEELGGTVSLEDPPSADTRVVNLSD